MLNKQSIKLDWLKNIKAKYKSNAHTKTKREREKWQNHLELFSFLTLEEPLRLANPWTGGEGKELKPFKLERNMRVLRRSPREQERIEADSGCQMLSCRCSVKWQATCSNLVEYDRQLHNDDRDAASFV